MSHLRRSPHHRPVVSLEGGQKMRKAPATLSARRSPLTGIVAGIVFVLLTTGASAAPAPFSLTFDGVHVSDPTTPFGLRHEGRFTAAAPFCPSGWAHDTRQIDDGGQLTVWRVYECDDGTGSFTAFLPFVRSEHEGSGSWKVVEGTGRYAQLRGQGTYIGTHLSGDPNDFATVTYRAQWQGVVDFDADAPAIESLSASAQKRATRLPTYTLRVTVTGRDASQIAYIVDVRAGKVPLGLKRVAATTGRAATTLRIRPPRAARSVRVSVTATDALGNGPATAARTVRLR
jgi:hypothetical protein